MFDALIVGGGPAGLQAALILGRARRQVLLCDEGKPRNAATLASHGFLTRDGIDPTEFRRLAREELRQYDGVELRGVGVKAVRHGEEAFIATLSDASEVRAARVLLASGLADDVPLSRGSSRSGARASSSAVTVTGGRSGISPWPCWAGPPIRRAPRRLPWS